MLKYIFTFSLLIWSSLSAGSIIKHKDCLLNTVSFSELTQVETKTSINLDDLMSDHSFALLRDFNLLYLNDQAVPTLRSQLGNDDLLLVFNFKAFYQTPSLWDEINDKKVPQSVFYKAQSIVRIEKVNSKGNSSIIYQNQSEASSLEQAFTESLKNFPTCEISIPVVVTPTVVTPTVIPTASTSTVVTPSTPTIATPSTPTTASVVTPSIPVVTTPTLPPVVTPTVTPTVEGGCHCYPNYTGPHMCHSSKSFYFMNCVKGEFVMQGSAAKIDHVISCSNEPLCCDSSKYLKPMPGSPGKTVAQYCIDYLFKNGK